MSYLGTVATKWLAENKQFLGSRDGLPGDFHREVLFNSIQNGSRVAIQAPRGSLLEGRAVMRGPAGWVLNLGGSHGTPGIASESNTIWVSGASQTLGIGKQKRSTGAQVCFKS